jgi:hypothetical protein
MFPKKLALTSPISRDRSAGLVRSRTQATEFSFLIKMFYLEQIHADPACSSLP